MRVRGRAQAAEVEVQVVKLDQQDYENAWTPEAQATRIEDLLNDGWEVVSIYGVQSYRNSHTGTLTPLAQVWGVFKRPKKGE